MLGVGRGGGPHTNKTLGGNKSHACKPTDPDNDKYTRQGGSTIREVQDPLLRFSPRSRGLLPVPTHASSLWESAGWVTVARFLRPRRGRSKPSDTYHSNRDSPSRVNGTPIPFRHVTPDVLVESYNEQVRGQVHGGGDLLTSETISILIRWLPWIWD